MLQRSVVDVKRLQSDSRRLDVMPLDPEHGHYLVSSSTLPGVHYEVHLNDEAGGRCSCRWAQYGGVNCKHVMAALRAHYAGQGTLSFWRTRGEARRQHRQVVEGEQIYATLRRRHH